MTQCDLSECGNFSEIVDAMKMFAEKKKFIQRCMDRRL